MALSPNPEKEPGEGEGVGRRGTSRGWWVASRRHPLWLPAERDRINLIQGFKGPSDRPRCLGQPTCHPALPTVDQATTQEHSGWPGHEASSGRECEPGHACGSVFNIINIYSFNVLRHVKSGPQLILMLWVLQMAGMATKSQKNVKFRSVFSGNSLI